MEFLLHKFPNCLSERTTHLLVASYFLHLNHKVQFSSMAKHQGTNNRVLLSGPEGTDVYQDALAIALSYHFGVKLLVLDCQTNLDVLSTFRMVEPNDALRFHTALPPFYKKSQSQAFKIGDRVIFTGLSSTVYSNFVSSGPSFGYRGKVMVMDTTNGLGVRFDLPFYGGNDLGGLCEAYCGFYCDGNEVCIDVEDEMKPISTPIQGFCAEHRLIVLVKHIENCLTENLKGFLGMSNMVNRLPENVFVIGSHIQKDCSKQKKNLCGTEESDQKFRMKLLSGVFPDEISIEMPEDKKQLDQLKSQLIRDSQLLKARENVARLKRVLAEKKLESEVIETILMTDLELTEENAEKVVKWALGHQLMSHRQYYINSMLVLSQASIVYGLNNLRAVQTYYSRGVQVVSQGSQGQAIPSFDAFEERILKDAVLHNDIGIKFDDIGALDYIKDSLNEVVVLPIKRPGLFRKGQLRKPCRGILLFGPPGTGKTMLAKAVAAEAGANIFNISASIIASKWNTDSQNFVKALFSLASKMAPSILFIDEADSLFGESRFPGPDMMGKIKNDFMLYWDGLHSKDDERIIVLAATNKPFVLDETFIRRVPRRLMVNLPDNPSRSKILKVILESEDLTEDVDFNAIAQMTNGFSGNDLKNLCIAAAHRPIREIILKDKLKSPVAAEEDVEIRPLNMEDFKDGFQQVEWAPRKGLKSMEDILEWNGLYGGGGGGDGDNSGGKPSVSYYI